MVDGWMVCFVCLGSAIIDRRCGVRLNVSRVAPPALRSMGTTLADTATLPRPNQPHLAQYFTLY